MVELAALFLTFRPDLYSMLYAGPISWAEGRSLFLFTWVFVRPSLRSWLRDRWGWINSIYGQTGRHTEVASDQQLASGCYSICQQPEELGIGAAVVVVSSSSSSRIVGAGVNQFKAGRKLRYLLAEQETAGRWRKPEWYLSRVSLKKENKKKKKKKKRDLVSPSSQEKRRRREGKKSSSFLASNLVFHWLGKKLMAGCWDEDGEKGDSEHMSVIWHTSLHYWYGLGTTYLRFSVSLLLKEVYILPTVWRYDQRDISIRICAYYY